jgi:hypothetical protein
MEISAQRIYHFVWTLKNVKIHLPQEMIMYIMMYVIDYFKAREDFKTSVWWSTYPFYMSCCLGGHFYREDALEQHMRFPFWWPKPECWVSSKPPEDSDDGFDDYEEEMLQIELWNEDDNIKELSISKYDKTLFRPQTKSKRKRGRGRKKNKRGISLTADFVINY